MLKDDNIIWVENNQLLLSRYIQENYDSIEQREYMEFIMNSYENSYSTRTILEDFEKSNQEKQQDFINKIQVGEPKVLCCIADKKEGKTMFSVGFVQFQLWLKGWKIYTAFPMPVMFINESGYLGKSFYFNDSIDSQEILELNSKGFYQFNITFVHKKDIPSDSTKKTIIYYDETSIEYPARDSMSQESIQLTADLNSNAHQGHTTFGSLQEPRQVDKNFLSNCKIKCYKHYTVTEIESREGFFSPIIKELMPKKGDITKVLIDYEQQLSSFYFIPMEFTKEISHYLSKIRDMDEDLALYLLKFYDIKKVKSVCKTKYSVELPDLFWKEQEFIQKIQIDKMKLKLNTKI